MRRHNRRYGLGGRAACGAVLGLAILGILSCAGKDSDADLRLPESLYGFHLGETKDEVFAQARNIARVTPAPDPPLGYRGELYHFSAPLEPHPEVDYVRCAFFRGRLMEIIVHFRDTSPMNLDWLKLKFEGAYGASFTAEDPTREMAQKTYRMSVPGMSVTLRRITKKERIELYVQYLHDELHRQLLERAANRENR